MKWSLELTFFSPLTDYGDNPPRSQVAYNILSMFMNNYAENGNDLDGAHDSPRVVVCISRPTARTTPTLESGRHPSILIHQ